MTPASRIRDLEARLDSAERALKQSLDWRVRAEQLEELNRIISAETVRHIQARADLEKRLTESLAARDNIGEQLEKWRAYAYKLADQLGFDAESIML